jgi:pimeloyl-ACP methyl ester carboxylesterase
MHPTILVPGIQGTQLADHYPVPSDPRWTTFDAGSSKYVAADMALALDSFGAGDSSPESLIEPHSPLSIAYKDFLIGVRAKLRSVRGLVFPFAYDWRYSNSRSAERLYGFVRRLQERSFPQLHQWAPFQPDRSDHLTNRVNFVGHSMGGLVIREFFSLWKERHPDTLLPVGRVAFLGTPHLGSMDAVEGMIRGKALIFGGREAFRKLVRALPSIYELLPRGSVAERIRYADGRPVDIWDRHQWQDNVHQSPDQIVERHLLSAREFLDRLPNPIELLGPDRVLTVCSVDAATLARITVTPRQGLQRFYDFDGKAPLGDDTVLEESARAIGGPCVRLFEKDMGTWTSKEWISFHAFMLTEDKVQTIVKRFLNGLNGRALLPLGMREDQFVP